MVASPRQAEPAESPWDQAPDHVSYRTTRENVSLLLADRPEAADLPVPACPDWTVRDLVAHLVENCRSAYDAFTEGPAAPAFAAADAGLAELLAEWAATGEKVEELLADNGRGRVMLMDAFTHELDIRRALDAPPPADHPAYPGTLDLVVGGFSSSVATHGLPTLRIETSGAHWTTGAGEPAATVHAHRHDLYRSLTGRRTLAQIGELSWHGSGSASAWAPAFTWGPFHPPAAPTESTITAR